MRNRLVYLLFTLGGIAALTYEVLWMRSFRVVFGSSTQSAAAVLAAFFGGMAVGNWIGARLARRGRPIRRYAVTELWIGATALLVAPWLALFTDVYPRLYTPLADRPALWVAARFLLAAAALLPPTVGIGVTLPLAIRAVVPISGRLARVTSQLYALNVVGAATGAALAGFVLPMSIGVVNSIYLAAALNALIGLAALALSLASGEQPVAEPAAIASEQPSASPRSRVATSLVAVAIVSGFGTLALEVLYFRILSFRTDGSVFSFGLMLIIFLLCLAAGSLIVARIGDRSNLWRLLAFTQLAGMIGILLTPFVFDVALGISLLSDVSTVWGQIGRITLVSLPTMGATVVLAGVVLPAAWRLAARDPGMMGQTVGRLVAFNTLAGVGGSLVAGFVLLPWLGLGGSLLLVAALYGLVAMGGFVRGFRGFGRWLGCAACLLVLVGWYGGGAWKLIDAAPLGEDQELVRYVNGPAATVAVVEDPSGHRILRMNQTYTLGSTGAAAREVRQGRIPLALHPRPRRAAFIGVATGMTVSAVLDFPIEQAVAIELVPEVADALPDFRRWNRGVFDDPRVELVVEDGRNYLLGTDERFDVIVSDLFIPWHAGTGDLYTVKHFQVAASRLAAGGLFAQWLPGYQLTVEEIRTVAASMLRAFDRVSLWRCDFNMAQPLVCLVGNNGTDADLKADWESQCRRLAESAGPRAPFLSTPFGIGMLYVAGPTATKQWATGAALNTDNFPVIEYTTPGSYFRHRQRDVEPHHRWLAEFRPRRWEFFVEPPAEDSIDDAFRAADLLHDAQRALRKNRFRQQFQHLSQLAELAGANPAVVDHVIAAAARYRARQMTARADQLLSTLAELPDPPKATLVALADLRRSEDRLDDAIELLSRALDQDPAAIAVRKAIIELLEQTEQYALIEDHLQHILDGNPDDPFLRLDLARALDRQGKSDAAREHVERFRRLRLGDDQRKAWRYLRSLKLGKYVDQLPDQNSNDRANRLRPPTQSAQSGT